MTVDNTGRFAIYEWSAAADPFTRQQMSDSHRILKERAAGYVSAANSAEANSASADLAGYFYYTSNDSNPGTLQFCNGQAWFDINAFGAVASLDGNSSNGSATTYSRSDHTHSLDNSIVTTDIINDLAVNSDKLASNAVVTTKIADGNVTNAKLAADGFDAGKLTTGTLNVDRIDANAVTRGKLSVASARSVIGNATGSSATPADIVANADGDILRRSGTTIGFGKINTSSINSFEDGVEDIVGGLITGGTSIDVTYNDSAGTLTLDHANTSSQASSNSNSGGTVIQNITLDAEGHVTGLGTKALSAADVGAEPSHSHPYLSSSGGTLTGDLTIQGGDLTIGKNGGGDSDIHFYDDNSDTTRTLRWDDSANDWRIEANDGYMKTLYHSGNIPSYAASTHNHDSSYAPSSHNHSYVAVTNGQHNGTLYMYGPNTLGVGNITMGTPTSNGNGQIRIATTVASNTNITVDTQHSGLSGAYYVFSIYHNGVNKGSISHNGTTTSYNTSSDYRLKENIVDLDDGLNVVNRLMPRRFTFKNNDTDQRVHTGFIAHEVQEVMPELVIGEKDAVDSDGNDIIQVIDKSGIIAVLVSAVQELSKEVDALKLLQG